MSDEDQKDVEMNSDEELEEEEEDQEDKIEKKIKELDELLSSDPYNYQAHVDKIDALKSLGELDRLRDARETFAKSYPLSPELWLSWVRDEQNLASTDQEKEKVSESILQIYNLCNDHNYSVSGIRIIRPSSQRLCFSRPLARVLSIFFGRNWNPRRREKGQRSL